MITINSIILRQLRLSFFATNLFENVNVITINNKVEINFWQFKLLPKTQAAQAYIESCA